MNLEAVISAPTIEGRSPMIQTLANTLKAIEGEVKSVKQDLEHLEDKERQFTASFAQVGVTLTIRPRDEVSAQLREAAKQILRERLSKLHQVKRDLCRTSPSDITNGEKWQIPHLVVES